MLNHNIDEQSHRQKNEIRIYDNGVIVKNLIFCRRKSDGVIGMYDTINQVFYPNK